MIDNGLAEFQNCSKVHVEMCDCARLRMGDVESPLLHLQLRVQGCRVPLVYVQFYSLHSQGRRVVSYTMHRVKALLHTSLVSSSRHA